MFIYLHQWLWSDHTSLGKTTAKTETSVHQWLLSDVHVTLWRTTANGVTRSPSWSASIVRTMSCVQVDSCLQSFRSVSREPRSISMPSNVASFLLTIADSIEERTVTLCQYHMQASGK